MLSKFVVKSSSKGAKGGNAKASLIKPLGKAFT